MVLVHLQQIGPVPPFLVSRDDLTTVLACAEEVLAEFDSDELDAVLRDWETGLTWRSLGRTEVDDAWYTRALLVTCLRGLRGEIRPEFSWLPGD